MVFLGIYTPHIKKGYWRFHIPLRKLLDAAGLEYGVRVRIKLYIEDVGELEKNLLLKSSYIDIHIPRKYSHLIKPNKKHKIYLVDVSRDVNRLERNTIIYGGGRKARIEIPQWYLKQNHITRETILKVEAEYDGEKHILFGRYRGAGPHIQSLPPMKTYPSRVTVTKIEKYSLEDFIDDFNRITQKTSNYKNIRLHGQEGKLTIVIDREKVDIREYYLGTYAHYTYLIIRIHGIEGFKTLRIHNHGNKIKIYYLQHTKKHKLKDHAAYLPITDIINLKDQIVFYYYDPRRNRMYQTILILRYKKGTRLINKITHETFGEYCVYEAVLILDAQLHSTFLRKIYRNRFPKFIKELGNYGETIAKEFLITKGFKVTTNRGNGPDIFITYPMKAVVEVKTTLFKNKISIKLHEAKAQVEKRLTSYDKLAIAVYIDPQSYTCKIFISPPLFLSHRRVIKCLKPRF